MSGVKARAPAYQVKRMESMVADSDSLRDFDLFFAERIFLAGANSGRRRLMW